MSFDSFAAFLAMGGHGPYVWSAYAITLVVLILNLVSPLRLRRQFFLDQARQLRRDEAQDSMVQNSMVQDNMAREIKE